MKIGSRTETPAAEGSVLGVFVAALRAVGFRNLNTTIEVCHPLAVVVGENNAARAT